MTVVHVLVWCLFVLFWFLFYSALSVWPCTDICDWIVGVLLLLFCFCWDIVLKCHLTWLNERPNRCFLSAWTLEVKLDLGGVGEGLQMIFGIFNYTCCVCEVCCFFFVFFCLTVWHVRKSADLLVFVVVKGMFAWMFDALTHVKRVHMEGKGGDLLKEGVKASWQQIGDYGFRAVFVKVQWDFPCKGYKIGPEMTDLPPPCKTMCSAWSGLVHTSTQYRHFCIWICSILSIFFSLLALLTCCWYPHWNIESGY